MQATPPSELMMYELMLLRSHACSIIVRTITQHFFNTLYCTRYHWQARGKPGDDAAILQQALRDRDEAIAKYAGLMLWLKTVKILFRHMRGWSVDFLKRDFYLCLQKASNGDWTIEKQEWNDDAEQPTFRGCPKSTGTLHRAGSLESMFKQTIFATECIFCTANDIRY